MERDGTYESLDLNSTLVHGCDDRIYLLQPPSMVEFLSRAHSVVGRPKHTRRDKRRSALLGVAGDREGVEDAPHNSTETF